MIAGRTDTWLTIEEFAAMVGRSEKTIRNWAAEGRIQFVYLCGMPLVALSMIESLITGRAPAAGPSDASDAALRAIGRRDHAGRRTDPERHARQRRMTGESARAPLLPSSEPAVGSSP